MPKEPPTFRLVENYFLRNAGTLEDCARNIGRPLEDVKRVFPEREQWRSNFHLIVNSVERDFRGNFRYTDQIHFIAKQIWAGKWGRHYRFVEMCGQEALEQVQAEADEYEPEADEYEPPPPESKPGDREDFRRRIKLIDEPDGMTFTREEDLQRHLRKNIGDLEPGLEITDGGAEKKTGMGDIDITAKDGTKATVVIELKRGQAPRLAVAQIKDLMAAPGLGECVRGILVAADFDDAAIREARSINKLRPGSLKLNKYKARFRFEFEDVETG